MDCYVCDSTGGRTSAVAICSNCYVGLCREHLDEDLRSTGPGGTRLGCSHDPAAFAREGGDVVRDARA